MKKGLIIFFGFLIVGIMLNSFVVANDDSYSAIRPGTNVQITESARERVREEIITMTNAQGLEQRVFVVVEREVETENGKNYIKIKKTFYYPNGTQIEQKIKIIEYQEKGKTKRKFKLEGDTDEYDIEVEVEDDIEIEDKVVDGKTKFRARLSNGNFSNIEFMPNHIREMILKRLRLRNQTNMTIRLQEKVHKNIPRVVYNVQTNENGRFLGIFKIAIRVNAEVDPETGEVLEIKRPWWAFLVTPQTDDNGEEENNETEDNETNDNNNETDDNETVNSS